jgi:hypothetical protein
MHANNAKADICTDPILGNKLTGALNLYIDRVSTKRAALRHSVSLSETTRMRVIVKGDILNVSLANNGQVGINASFTNANRFYTHVGNNTAAEKKHLIAALAQAMPA